MFYLNLFDHMQNMLLFLYLKQNLSLVLHYNHKYFLFLNLLRMCYQNKIHGLLNILLFHLFLFYIHEQLFLGLLLKHNQFLHFAFLFLIKVFFLLKHLFLFYHLLCVMLVYFDKFPSFFYGSFFRNLHPLFFLCHYLK